MIARLDSIKIESGSIRKDVRRGGFQAGGSGEMDAGTKAREMLRYGQSGQSEASRRQQEIYQSRTTRWATGTSKERI
jgi:hypothetical protein